MTSLQEETAHAFDTLLGTEEHARLRGEWARLNKSADILAGLSADEMFAIWIYTTPRSFFSLINMALTTQGEPPHIRAVANLIDAGLKKLPVYQGTLYRGVKVPDPELFVSIHPLGREIEWRAFSSCTDDPETAYPYEVELVVHARRARRVTYYSGAYDDEFILVD